MAGAARLVYSAIASLDGYVADESGTFDWAAPDEEVHAFVNDAERPVGTYLYGRRMYEVMTAWDRPQDLPERTPAMDDYAAIWQAADKVVYSASLEAVTSARTRIEREFDPAAVRALVDAADRDVSVGGPTLAASAFRASLVDEFRLFMVPVLVGGGTRALPAGTRLSLELVDVHRFASGVVALHHRVRR